MARHAAAANKALASPQTRQTPQQRHW